MLTDVRIEFANRVALEDAEFGKRMVERVVCENTGTGVE